MVDAVVMFVVVAAGMMAALFLLRPVLFWVSSGFVKLLTAGIVLLRYSAVLAQRPARQFRRAVRQLRRETRKARYAFRGLGQPQT